MLFSCGNKDYIANPTTSANNSVNPLNLLDSAGFNWTGTNTISANVNGTNVVIDSTHCTFSLIAATGTNVITGYLGVNHGFYFSFSNVYAVNIYPMGYTVTDRYAAWSDSASGTAKTYYSYNGNVGQVQILRNDPLRLIAKFHFQGLDMINGTVTNVSNGWINIGKP